MNNAVISLTDKDFDEKISHPNILAFVKFSAPWCGPCKVLAPIVEELAKEPSYKDKINFFEVNIDDNPLVAQKYNIRAVPTILIFKNNQILETKIGGASKNQLEQLFLTHLS